MDRDLIYRISVRGAAESARALDGFGARLRALQEQEQAFDRATDSMNRRRGERDRATTRDSVREAETAARAKVKAAEQGARSSAREEERAARDAAKARTSAVRDAAREQIDIAKHAAKERERIEKDLNRVMLDAQKTTAREQAALHRQAVRDEERRMRDRAFDTKRLIRGTVDGVFEGAGSAFRAPMAMANMAGRGLRTVANGLGVNDAFDVQSVLSEQSMVRRLIDSVLVEARGKGQIIKDGRVYSAQGAIQFDSNAATMDIAKHSNALGIRQDVLAAAIDEGSRLGSGANIANNIGMISKFAKSYGGDEGAAKTAAKIFTQLGTSGDATGHSMTEQERFEFMAKLNMVGKAGSMRGSEYAEVSETLLSSFMVGNMDMNKQGDEALAWTQMVNATKGGGAKTATAIKGLASQLTAKDSKIQALGIETEGRSMLDIAIDLMGKTSREQMTKLLGGQRGNDALLLLRSAFDAGEKEKKGSGAEAARAKLMSFGVKMTGAEAMQDLNTDLGAQAETASDKLQTAMVKVRNALAEQLAPVMAQFATDAPVYAKVIGEVIAALGPAMRDSLLPALVELGKEAPKMAKSIADAAQQIGPIVKWFFGLAVENPKTAALLGLGASLSMGGIGGGGGAVLASVAKWTSEGLVNTVPHLVPGTAGKVLAGAAGVAGNIAGSVGSTPVYVTGVAPGVGLGGGGGVGDIAGAVGGSEFAAMAAGAGVSTLVASIGVLSAGIAGLAAGWYVIAPALMGQGTAIDNALKWLAGRDPSKETTTSTKASERKQGEQGTADQLMEERAQYYRDHPDGRRGAGRAVRMSLTGYGAPAADTPINTGDGVIHAPGSPAPGHDGVIRSAAAQKEHEASLKRATEANKKYAEATETAARKVASAGANHSAVVNYERGPG